MTTTALAEPEVGGGCAGRRPDGLAPAAACAADDALGRYLAYICHLEGAAVVAFALLERELVAHGAPPQLIERARRACRDEVRHAKVTGDLARRHGAEPAAVSVELRPPRSLLAMALDNAVEGCVRETYGALCAHYQATTANDTDVRSAWQHIAEEETAHALLSHDLDAWLLPQLSPTEREQVEAARRRAIDELYREVQAEPATAVRELASMPSAAHATQLIHGLEREVWSAAA